jgi:hypothetical protein
VENTKYKHSCDVNFSEDGLTDFLLVIIYTDVPKGCHAIIGQCAIPTDSRMFRTFTGLGLCMN